MTQPNFRELAQHLLHAYVWCIEEYMTAPAEKDALVLHARAALEATPPPEQKSSIDELIAGCKPLDPEMAEALTTEARWRLFGEDDRDDLPPHIRAKMESDELWAAFWFGRANEIENT